MPASGAIINAGMAMEEVLEALDVMKAARATGFGQRCE